MAKCEACGVEILDHTSVCPLCGEPLEKSGEEEHVSVYPNLILRKRKMIRAAEIIIICGAAAEALLVFLNLMLAPDLLWCIITGGGILYVIILMLVIAQKYMDLRVKFLILTLLGVAVVGCVDWFCGFGGWTLSLVLPMGILFLDAVVLTLVLTRKKDFREYIWIELLNLGLSMIPLAAARFGFRSFYPMAEIAALTSAAELVGTVLIGGERMIVEFRRRFHV